MADTEAGNEAPTEGVAAADAADVAVTGEEDTGADANTGVKTGAKTDEETDAETGPAEDPPRREGSYLRPGEQSAWERWELPAVDSGHVVARGGRAPSVEEAEIEVQPLSLEEIEAIREEARQEGFAEGREAGYREGREQGIADGAGEMQAQADALRAAIRALAQPLAELDDDLEEALAHGVVAIAHNVIGQELRARPEMIRDIVRRVVGALAEGRGPLRLHLHPEDLELLQDADADWCRGCELLPDAALSRGGVRADRGPSSTDFTLEQRFRAAVGEFVRDAYSPAPDPVEAPAPAAPADDEPPAAEPPAEAPHEPDPAPEEDR